MNRRWIRIAAIVALAVPLVYGSGGNPGGADTGAPGEAYFLPPPGYGTYTVQASSPLIFLDHHRVAAPRCISAAPGQEPDYEYSGAGGLIPAPHHAEFNVQPYTVRGNLVRHIQPSTSQETSQIEWRSDYVTLSAGNGWSANPARGDVIYNWTYRGSYVSPPGQERVQIDLGLLKGSAPRRGAGNAMVASSFADRP